MVHIEVIRRLSPSGKISFHIQDHLLVLVVIARLKQVLKIPNELKQCAGDTKSLLVGSGKTAKSPKSFANFHRLPEVTCQKEGYF